MHSQKVRMPQNFADFYSFAFQYCLTEDEQKWIDVKCICELLDIVMGSQFPSQVALFTKYLKIQNDYKVINMDQWTSFLRFCSQPQQNLNTLSIDYSANQTRTLPKPFEWTFF
ncbi:hypothetical protein LOK49_LG07G01196 [Camellia lanceoleosa]|uniref:Uncharacterized protein n=1 Tax=Camellia lanceoleosa TaxID=1840588 RepID=A0ACC0GY48_9ERIC|nr:hypothetical protein LOK49_LG07G01196 [Camellia lanceoleosa]